jgi:hypothetical protein
MKKFLIILLAILISFGTVNAGKPIPETQPAYSAFVWEGVWTTATLYHTNDVVEESGSSYVCLTNHTSGTFATDLSNSKWELMAQKGADGTQGIQGLPGADGTQGIQGIQGEQGIQGIPGVCEGGSAYHEGDITQYGAIPDGFDNTTVLQWCFDNLNEIYVPEGYFYFNGNIHINRPGITLEGASEYYSVLANTSNTDSFIVGSDVEFVQIKNIGLRGNYTRGMTESESTKRCFVLGINSVEWYFTNVFAIGFYGHIIDGGAQGYVNNIYIDKCDMGRSHDSAIHIVSKGYWQVNAIYIQNSNINYLETNGIDVWGNNIVIANNTIQACDEFAISLNGMESTDVQGHANGVLITGNYHEQCIKGFLQLSTSWGNGIDEWVGYDGYKYIRGLTVSGNFGECQSADPSGVIDIRSNNKQFANIENFNYSANAFYSDTKYLINTHGLFKTANGYVFNFNTYNPMNIDIFYPNIAITPSVKYEALIPLDMVYDGETNIYHRDLTHTGYQYIYFTKDNFNSADNAIEFWLKSDGVPSGDYPTFLINGDISYKATYDTENYTSYAQVTGAGGISDATVFRKISIPLPYTNIGAVAQSAQNVKYRIAIYLPSYYNTTYFEIKNIQVKAIK